MVWANLRVPSCAAAAFGKAIWPLTAMKNAGLASKYLIQAKGPSCVTEWETVCINARSARSIATASSGVTEWDWLAPTPQGTEAANVIATTRKRIRNWRERSRKDRTRVEDNIQSLHRPLSLSTTS